MKHLLAAGFLAASALTVPAGAVTVVKYDIPNKVKAHVTAPGGINGDYWMGMGKFTFADMSTEDIFCIDLGHSIKIGTFSPALNYVLGDAHAGLGVNSPGIGTLKEIAYLANWGFAANDAFKEQAVQGAIWTKLGGTVTVTNSALQTKIGQLAAWTNQVGYQPEAYFSTDKIQRQAQIAAVPEPASWALLIVGFGFVGGSLRHRRMSQVAA